MREFTSSAPADSEDEEAQEEPLAWSFSFKLDDETFTCSLQTEDESDAMLEWSEFASAALDGEDSESPAGAALLSKLLRLAMRGGEYQRFRRHLRLHHTHPSVLLDIIRVINEEMEAEVARRTAHPTKRPSPSSAGDTARGGRTSRVISLSKGEGDVQVVREVRAPQDRRQKQPRRKAASGG
jgi:hypothetical protein